ncbi:TetR/AcrR family transcriptional regulator [Actinospica sp.]|uniref:TetR/AcrR family transcriptional regulator n=1 Tax=Actinospica sp. TaxID=1872142 RepID=UPI002C1725DA|nr:TetR/AcrR family transcriptional regulator [Actinospica sp.]HWG28719.1 TetR/AcrR family transcriptional regulator [Actinospica sp.]
MGAVVGHVAEAAPREPQQDRSRATRQRLLEAAIECLAEHGWAGSTVAVVAERAGVTRGALQHHFPTREDLFTAAIEHVAVERLAYLRGKQATLPARGPARTEAVVDMFVRMYMDQPFRAALHLWVAAATEEPLRERVVALENKVGREAHRAAVAFLGVDEHAAGAREAVQATLDMARGLGLANLLTDDSARRARVIRRWAVILDAALAED